MANVDDNLYNIPSLTGNDTFLDWVNHYNTNVVAKLNNMKVFDGVSGDGIQFDLGTTASNDPSGGDQRFNDLPSGTIRMSLAEVIPNGTTFSGDVTINGTLNYDLSKNELSSIKSRVTPIGGFTATKGFTLGMPVRVAMSEDEGEVGEVNYYLGRADSKDYAEIFGIVSGVTWASTVGQSYTSTNTYVEVTTHGKVQGDFSRALADTDEYFNPPNRGLSAGCVYFLSPGNSGGITRTEPVVSGQVSKPVILGVTSDVGYVLQYRGQYLNSSGTGGTGGIDNNRFIVSVPSGSGIVRGNVVAYDPGQGVNNEGWFTVKSTDENLGNAVALCVKSPFTLDGQKYIELVSTGFVDDVPVSDDGTGVLYVDNNGKLVSQSNAPGTLKPFAIAWRDSATGTIRANIINQSGIGSSSSNRSRSDSGSSRDYASESNSNWARRSTSQGGATYGSAINENILINGGFDVWQRRVGTDGSHGATGTMYFADKWVRVDGMSAADGGNSPTVYSIERKEFDTNQIDVYGTPKYYASLKNTVSGANRSKGDFVYIQNRVEDVRTCKGEDVTISFFAKCGITGATMDINIEQYDGTNTTRTSPTSVQLGTLWDKFEVSFFVPNVTSSPTGKHYVGFGFDTTRLGTELDLAQVKIERGMVATKNASSADQGQKELEKCKRYYRRSYSLDEKTHSSTMQDTNNPSVSVVDFTLTPSQDHYEKFDVEMRGDPVVTFFSPKTGYTGDAFNRTSGKDARLADGTVGYSGLTRVGTVGAEGCITAQYSTKNGLYLFVPCGVVLWDDISVHYVADSDLDENMPNKG